jgi:hypothetical protein
VQKKCNDNLTSPFIEQSKQVRTVTYYATVVQGEANTHQPKVIIHFLGVILDIISANLSVPTFSKQDWDRFLIGHNIQPKRRSNLKKLKYSAN